MKIPLNYEKINLRISHLSGDKKTKMCGSESLKCYLIAADELFEEDFVDRDNDQYAETFRKECKCLPSCTSIDYSADINSIKFDMNILKNSKRTYYGR